MKSKLAALSAVAVTLLSLCAQHESQAAPSGTGGPTTTLPRPLPRLEVQLPPSIAGLSFYGGGTTKPNADPKTFALEVPIRGGGGSAPRSGTLHVKRGVSTILNAPFTVTGSETKSIPVAGPIGLDKACDRVAEYELQIEGSGFDTKKKAKVTADCTFTSTNVNPWNILPPDRAADRTKNKVFYSNVRIGYHQPVQPAQPEITPKMNQACGSHISVKANVTNNLSHAVTNIVVSANLNGESKGAGGVSLAAGETKEVTFTFYFWGEAGAYDIKLADTNNSAGGQIDNAGFHFDIGRTCSLTAALLP